MRFCVHVGLFDGSTTHSKGQSQPGLVLLLLPPTSVLSGLPVLWVLLPVMNLQGELLILLWEAQWI